MKLFLPIILVLLFAVGFLIVRPQKLVQDTIIQKVDCGEDCIETIKEEVAKAVTKITPLPAPSVIVERQTQVVTQTTIQNSVTQIIPLGGSFSTTSSEWTNIPGSEATLNLKKDYGENATISFQISLKVPGGNGEVSARLYDTTNNLAVYGSEIKTTNNTEFKSVSSGNLILWAGYNTYRIQIKSSNSNEVTATGGGLKVVAK